MFVHPWTQMLLLLMLPLIFLLFVVSKNMKSISKKFYFITLSSFIFWLLFNFLYVNASSLKLAVFYYSLLLISVSMVASSLFLTAVNFHKKASVWSYLFSLLPLMVLVLIVPCNLRLFNYGWQAIYSLKNFVWGSIVFIVILSGIFILFNLRKKVRSKLLKKKMFYLIIGSFLSLFSGVLATPLTILYNLPSLSGLFASVFVMVSYLAFKK